MYHFPSEVTTLEFAAHFFDLLECIHWLHQNIFHYLHENNPCFSTACCARADSRVWCSALRVFCLWMLSAQNTHKQKVNFKFVYVWQLLTPTKFYHGQMCVSPSYNKLCLKLLSVAVLGVPDPLGSGLPITVPNLLRPSNSLPFTVLGVPDLLGPLPLAVPGVPDPLGPGLTVGDPGVSDPLACWLSWLPCCTGLNMGGGVGKVTVSREVKSSWVSLSSEKSTHNRSSKCSFERQST